nr:linear amide C-N hydrolase [uncultured Flavobacterium sp.]
MKSTINNVSFRSFDELQYQGENEIAPFACTTLIVKDLNNNVYHGRGMELTFGEGLSSLTFYPKGYAFQHLAPDQSKGLQYVAKFGIMAVTTPVSAFDPMCAMEGVNDAGLSFSLNMMPALPLKDITVDQYPNSVPFASFGEWALANFATTEDLKAGISSGAAFWSESLTLLGGVKTPFHFAVYDKTGGSVVVEVKNGELIIYDNPTGVMTNGPEFPWHIENLNNYSHLSNVETTVGSFGNGITLKQPDSGIATTNLPASSTSVGRFVKAFYYSNYANKVADPDLQLAELGHVMNNFDRPKNITKEVSSLAKDGTPEKYMTEFTLWIVLTDLSRGILYVRTYDNLNYQKYTFEQFANQTAMVSTKLV